MKHRCRGLIAILLGVAIPVTLCRVLGVMPMVVIVIFILAPVLVIIISVLVRRMNRQVSQITNKEAAGRK
ncbi:hypothetical protein C4546_03795 [Candidatus Parcubacteria bacterium]|jgi:Flp pilus assembly protein TadB|nr:MAG: hypothetical protein C4546_03795 [Candidatus Parcubacteria bacterium]